MISIVYENARRARLLDELLVATDDERILKACSDLGIPVRMTSAAHVSGTDRIAEVAKDMTAALIINIQGDEPLLDPGAIDALVGALQDPSVEMASLMTRVRDQAAFEDLNRVKVVVDANGDALYFSRAPIPCRAPDGFFQHIGIYGYRREFLFRFCALPPSGLEKAERLEQLRALEYGHRIRMVEVRHAALSVDTPRDIIEVERVLRGQGHD